MTSLSSTRGNIISATLAASAILGLVATFGFFLVALSPDTYTTSIEITPTAAVVSVDNTFVVNVDVESITPVNAFAGHITFDPSHLTVEKIDYNTSIADLWAEAPWYKDGDGTIQFAGGTTKAGGFIGRGTLLTITFRTHLPGAASVEIKDATILKYDGLGSEAPLATPIDGLFTVMSPDSQTTIEQNKTAVLVRDPKLTADFNSDGHVTVTDLSIFFVDLSTGNKESDLNHDGRISTSDLSILLLQMSH
jgi:hypothetical protein